MNLSALFEILLTFVGAMLILSLVSQSLLEAAKAAFPLESFTRSGSVRRLLRESATANELDAVAGDEIYDAVARRLRGLGQNGVRGVRLDSINAEDLRDLVKSLKDRRLVCLNGCSDPEARLAAIGESVEKWFALAMNPVSERYRRRMRGANVAAATLIVALLNVDAIALMERARSDPEFRQAVLEQVSQADTLFTRARLLEAEADSLVGILRLAVGDPNVPPPTSDAGARVDSLRSELADITERLDHVADGTAGLFQPGAARDPTSGRWWAGLAVSVLLISLGAPFWHDLLGSLFGVKNRIDAEVRDVRARAKRVTHTLPDAAGRSP